MWSPVDLAQIVGGFATGFTVAIAIVGAFIAANEINTARETSAIAAFQDYQRLAFEHAGLAKGGAFDSEILEQRERYRWFVGIAFTAFERIMLARPTAYWRGTCVDHLRYHVAFLSSAEFAAREHHYAPPMRRLFAEAIALGPRHEPGAS